MNIVIARGARSALYTLLLCFLYACTGGGGNDVEPLLSPSLTPIGDQRVEELQLLTFTVSASKEGSSPVLSVTNLPPGATFDTDTGAFSWTPVIGDARDEPYQVTFTATDAVETALTDSETVNIKIEPAGSGIAPVAAAPVIVPNGGAFVDSVSVSITSATEGAQIFYTLDGSDPTENSTQYAGPFDVTQSGTVNARAFLGGFTDSNLSRAIFTITASNQPPVLSPVGDKVVVENATLTFTVAATDAETTPVLSATNLPAGATFDPATGAFSWTPALGTSTGSPYSVTFTATDAEDANLSASETIAITVTAAPNTPPTLTPIGPRSIQEGQPLVFEVSASDAESVPVITAGVLPADSTFQPPASPDSATRIFSWTPPAGASAASPYTVIFTATDATDPALTAREEVIITVTAPPPAAAPAISPNGGTITTADTVTLTTTTAGGEIRYTVDGTEPTETSTLYTAPFTLGASASTTVTAKTFATGFSESVPTAATFAVTATPVAATPVISPASGTTITDSDTVTIATTTSGAQIRYTLDGSVPTATTGFVYSVPFSLPQSASTTVTARTFAIGFVDSATATATFTVTATPTVATPVISPASGTTITESDAVTITTATSGAQIRYTTDGSVPTATTGIPYSAPFSLPQSASTTVTARAFATGFVDSATATATYAVTATPVAATPVITPAGGTITDSDSISITTTTGGAQIRYTLNGIQPTATTGTAYTVPFTIAQSAGTTVTAIAFATGLTNSAPAQATFVVNAATADCTVGITSPVTGDLIAAGQAGDDSATANLNVQASLACTPAVPAGWRVKLLVSRLNRGGGDEVIVSSPYATSFADLGKDEYTVTASVVDADNADVDGVTPVTASPVGIGDYYVAIGDSITQGVGGGTITSTDGRNSGGYPALLNNALTSALGYPHTIVNVGIPSERSGNGRDRIEDVLDAHPDAQRVLVMYGMNDARPPSMMMPWPPGFSGVGQNPAPANTYKANMQQMITEINLSGKEVVLAKVNIALADSADDPPEQYYDDPDAGARSVNIKEINRVIDELVAVPSNNISVAPPDFYNLFLTGARYEAEYAENDAIHPNGTGYQRMANEWLDRLTE